MNNQITTIPEIFSVKDVQEILKISKTGVYNLFNRSDFPAIQIGGRKLVAKEDFFAWLEKQKKKPEPQSEDDWLKTLK